jgi:hypothetical protein
VLLAQLFLPQRPALIVGVSGELVALARQPRMVHRAEYPHASK